MNGHNEKNDDDDNNNGIRRERSFEFGDNSFQRKYGQRHSHYSKNNNTTTTESKWLCVSPMTKHVIRESWTKTGPELRRNRSRSFNDYIDRKQDIVFSTAATTGGGGGSGSGSGRNKNDLLLPTILHHHRFIPPASSSSSPSPYKINETTDISAATEDALAGSHAFLLQPQKRQSSVAPIEPTEYDGDGGVGDYYYNDDTETGNNNKEKQLQLQLQQQQDNGNPVWISILYGLINATIVLPVVMSFGNIIYSDEAFSSYTPVLIKLTLISGVVHQLCFSAFSTLPFVVGSVQDAGLIFLSSMAKDMALYCKSRGHDDETMLATVTIGLGVATATLGIGLIIVGRLRLAGYVQMLPTCVVAGYLAFIGWFCGKSGISLMAGTSNLTIPYLWENIIFVIPGVLGGIFIYWSVRTLRHIAVLPCCIFIILILFYSGLIVAGSSVEQATKNGWIRESEPAPVWYHTWDYLKFDKVIWSAIPQLLLTEISMIFVVALSSSLDVAAIELEMKQPLNYNQELTMIGVSNMISGLTGGYTGSYIFSQSIFSLRSGIRSRLAGVTLAICQAIVIVTPFPILSYVPNFFYGSLLGMICIDLVYEWLWDFRTKAKTAEYLIGLSTFGMIQVLGVEYGILAGVLVYIVCRQLGIDVGDLKIVTDESEEEKKRQSIIEAKQQQYDQDPEKELLLTSSPSLSSMNGNGQYNTILPPLNQGAYQTNGG